MILKIQMEVIKFQKDKIVKILRNGGIGVMPTDTIYGIVGQALNEKAVERIYAVRKRMPSKPMIILIDSFGDLKPFDVYSDKKIERKLNEVWPGKVSVVLPLEKTFAQEKFYYLHRGTNSLAFRLPDNNNLRNLISKTGPLVAPSANLEGLPPAKTIEEARNYFGNEADFYVDDGKIEGPPSKLIKLENGKIIELRK